MLTVNKYNNKYSWAARLKQLVWLRKQLLMTAAMCFVLVNNFAQTITLTPERAFAYTDGVGVNTHLRYTHLAYYTDYENMVYQKLKAAGIKHVRDNYPYQSFLGSVSASLMRSRYLKLYDSLGIRFSYVLDSRRVIDSSRFLNNGEYLEVFDHYPELVKTIQCFEGFNEPDRSIQGWFPATWASLTNTIQQSLWNKAHSMPAISHVEIVGPSVISYGPAPSRTDSLGAVLPHISNYFDLANYHPYDYDGGSSALFPGSRYDGELTYYDTIRKAKPWIVSEMGYSNTRGFNNPASCNFRSNSFHYTSELAAGKYFSVLFMEMFKRGAKRVYTYELLDQDTKDQADVEHNFGLIHTDGSEKPAFTAIKNTLAILKDTNELFTPVPLSFSLNGDTAGVQYSLYQKKNGNYYLALWLGAGKGVCYDYTSFTDIEVNSQQLQITLPFISSAINVYQPLNTVPLVSSYVSKDTLTLSVPDNLLLIEILPAAIIPLLVDFQAERIDREQVQLNWQASSNSQSGHFVLERSTDGVHFNTIHQQTSSAFNHQYSYLNHQPTAAFYRLQHIDKTGKKETSSIKWVSDWQAERRMTASPNPFNSFFSVSVSKACGVTIYNATGIAVLHKLLPTGSSVVSMQEMASGVYFMLTDDGKQRIKLIKQ